MVHQEYELTNGGVFFLLLPGHYVLLPVLCPQFEDHREAWPGSLGRGTCHCTGLATPEGPSFNSLAQDPNVCLASHVIISMSENYFL